MDFSPFIKSQKKPIMGIQVFKFILRGHLDEKIWRYPKDGGRVSHQSLGGKGPLWEKLSHHFEKYLHAMELKLSGYVRINIPLLYINLKMKKPGEIPIFTTFMVKILNFHNFFTKIAIFTSEVLHGII